VPGYEPGGQRFESSRAHHTDSLDFGRGCFFMGIFHPLSISLVPANGAATASSQLAATPVFPLIPACFSSLAYSVQTSLFAVADLACVDTWLLPPNALLRAPARFGGNKKGCRSILFQ
ncbi:hypothetical protein, partial [Aeromonas jandaei]|uniref:hypothetical protein n=1 Tax=Aeromonas jandaei TaxID=650 RepID=UPI0038B52E29